MNPIYQQKEKGKKGLQLEDFKKEFISIRNSHSKEKKILAFAFVLYCYFGNPQLSKIFDDTDYWEALNSISGNYLSIFYVDSKLPIS